MKIGPFPRSVAMNAKDLCLFSEQATSMGVNPPPPGPIASGKAIFRKGSNVRSVK